MKKRSTAIAILVLLFVSTGSSGQDLQSRTTRIPQPKALDTFAPESFIAPNSAYIKMREAQLRRHHLPTPFTELALENLLLPRPEPASASAVVNYQVAREPGPIDVVINRALRSAEIGDSGASHVAEPSIAVRSPEILLTGNWFASFSRDGGATFSFINPATTFPSVHGGFCCDQVAHYDPERDVIIWLLQYIKTSDGNTLRLAVASGADISTDPMPVWRYYDLTPQSIGGWEREWFDYPDLVVGDRFLYLSTNVFSTTSNRFTRSVMMRIPLDAIRAYESFTLDYVDSADVGSLRATRGASGIMHWGTHLDRRTLRVYSWPGNSSAVSTRDVSVDPWTDDEREATAPNGAPWLGRVDRRITAAWATEDSLGFGWTASQDARYLYPQVRFAIIDRNTFALKQEPHLWNDDFAFAYPDVATNANGAVGITVQFGGNIVSPSQAVGLLEPTGSGGPLKWRLAAVSIGTHGPSENLWGDYLAIRRHGRNGEDFVATGFDLQGGNGEEHVTVRYLLFREAAPRPATNTQTVGRSK